MEMEEAIIGGHNVYRMIKDTLPRKPSIDGMIKESDASLQERCAKQFRE